MNLLFRLKSFFTYFINAKGIGNIHSPFVYEFILRVLNDRRTFYAYDEIESIRNKLIHSKQDIAYTELGAGSTFPMRHKKKIGSIIKKSSKPPCQSQLLFRMANYYQCSRIIELGTNMGISAMYLASGGTHSRVISIEGVKEFAAIARNNADALELNNLEIIEDDFENALPLALAKFGLTDLVYFDGNHRKSATLDYFNLVLPYLHEKSILIFDDIYWSSEMYEAWQEIKANPTVTVTIDLYYFGIVFFRKELSKQNFMLRW